MRKLLTQIIITALYLFPGFGVCDNLPEEKVLTFKNIKSIYTQAKKLEPFFPDSAIYYYQNGLNLLEELSGSAPRTALKFIRLIS